MKVVFSFFIALILITSSSVFAASKSQVIYTAQEDVMVKITTARGQVLANDQLQENASYRLDPENFQSGIYTFKVVARGRVTEECTLVVSQNLPSGFLLARVIDNELQINFYDIDPDEVPYIQHDAGLIGPKIKQHKKTANASVCIALALTENQGFLSVFDRNTERYLISLRHDGVGALAQEAVIPAVPVLADATKIDIPEERPDVNGNDPHSNHAVFKRALLGIKNACPNPRLDLAETRQEVLDKIAEFKADPAERVKFNKTLSANSRIDYFPFLTDGDRQRIYCAASDAHRGAMLNGILVTDGDQVDEPATFAARGAFLNSVRGLALNETPTSVINILDYVDRPLGIQVEPATGNMFDDLGKVGNRYLCRNEIDDRDRALQEDDIFYVDRIFRGVWKLIKTYADAGSRELMIDGLLRNLFVMVEEGHGRCNCNRGKLVQLILPLQGYYPFAQFDAVNEVPPRPTAIAFTQQINRELPQENLVDELKIFRDVCVYQDLDPALFGLAADVEIPYLPRQRYDALIQQANNMFDAALTYIRARFENEGLHLMPHFADQRTALYTYNEIATRWRQSFVDVIQNLSVERQRRIAAGHADVDPDAPANAGDAGQPQFATDAEYAAWLGNEFGRLENQEAHQRRLEEREQRRAEAAAEFAAELEDDDGDTDTEGESDDDTSEASESDDDVGLYDDSVVAVETTQILGLKLAEKAKRDTPYFIRGEGIDGAWYYGPKPIDINALPEGQHIYKAAPSGKSRQEVVVVDQRLQGRALKIDNHKTLIFITIMQAEPLNLKVSSDEQALVNQDVNREIVTFDAPYGVVEITLTLPGQDPIVVNYNHAEN